MSRCLPCPTNNQTNKDSRTNEDFACSASDTNKTSWSINKDGKKSVHVRVKDEGAVEFYKEEFVRENKTA
jgi:hypothetical protein